MLLIFFAFLAGLVTILSPCTLPVLPALLAVGVGKGRLRPLGMAVGFTFSFTIFTLSASWLVSTLGLPPNFMRAFAVVVLLFAGLTLIFPSLGAWFSAKAEIIAEAGRKLGNKSKQITSGFWSGFFFGIALGLIWTPCAGPILAAVLTLSATSEINSKLFFVILAYSIGAALPMLLIAYTTKRLSLGPYIEKIRRTFGVLLIIGAGLIWFDFAVIIQAFSAKFFPPIQIENNSYVLSQLADMQGGSGEKNEGQTAPAIIGITKWINSEPLNLEELKGKVVMVDFWTYSCINCVRTLPYLEKWYETYKDQGFILIGVHSPEFEFEKNITNVEEAVKRFGLTYPVAMDNQFKTWKNWHNIYWPAHYLINKNGIVTYTHFGEGSYMETENQIRRLLGLGPLDEKEVEISSKPLTPETYLGYKRASAYLQTLSPDTSKIYDYNESLSLNQVGLKGEWQVDAEKITSMNLDSTLNLKFLASKVYLVLSGKGMAQITLDGKFYKNLQLDGEKLYTIIDLEHGYGPHQVELKLPKNTSAYAFTFGD